jgi:hypothetical protein
MFELLKRKIRKLMCRQQFETPDFLQLRIPDFPVCMQRSCPISHLISAGVVSF